MNGSGNVSNNNSSDSDTGNTLNRNTSTVTAIRHVAEQLFSLRSPTSSVPLKFDSSNAIKSPMTIHGRHSPNKTTNVTPRSNDDKNSHNNAHTGSPSHLSNSDSTIKKPLPIIQPIPCRPAVRTPPQSHTSKTSTFAAVNPSSSPTHTHPHTSTHLNTTIKRTPPKHNGIQHQTQPHAHANANANVLYYALQAPSVPAVYDTTTNNTLIVS